MAELDHLIFASPDVDAGIDLIEKLTGARAVAGGPHVGLGTHNALLTFDDRTYFEIIGIDPAQPNPERARPFGLDDRTAPGLAGYAIHPTGDETLADVVAAMEAAGIDPGTTSSMSRMKPDGNLLEWSLTLGGNTGVASDGALPFAIDWGSSPSPAVSLPSMGALVSLTVHHPNADYRSAAEALGVGIATTDAATPALVAVIETPNGQVELPS